jgi:mycothiol synthase
MHPVPYEESAVIDLVRTVTRTDGHPPFSAFKLESIGRDRVRTGAWSDDASVCVVGIAAFHESGGRWAVEVAVAPPHRDSHTEEAAIRLSAALVPDDAVHTVWAFRDDQISAARRLGYDEIRAVARMAGPIPMGTVGDRPSITVDSMKSVDAGGILGVNNRAFLGHPEQGAMTEEDLASLMAQPWFDPAGVLVGKDGTRIVGFCVTKYEEGQAGEIFVVAVDPTYQNSGIGRDLIGSGLDVLRRRGTRRVIVWVDASNDAAIRLYESLGLAEDFRTREFTLP